MGHKGVQAMWGEHEKDRGCCRKPVWGDRQVQVYDRETRAGQAEDVGHRGMQGE